MPRRLSRRDLAAALAQTRDELRRSKRELQKLHCENEILREAAEPLIHHAAARERFAFIHARRDRFGVKRLCRALVADSSNYFAWVRAQAKRRVREHDEQWIAELITEVHAAHLAYGA
jgi:putative transposase